MSSPSSAVGLQLSENVSLAEHTTLGVGGLSRYFARVEHSQEWSRYFAWATQQRLPVWILGGGSNVVIADAGLPGLVLQPAGAGLQVYDDGDTVAIDVAAGHAWDALVARAVAESWSGIECLSGIPGLVGAAPIQNIGAYGQEVSGVVEAVGVVERGTGRAQTLASALCGLAYRSSNFKGAWRDRYVVTSLQLRLHKDDVGHVSYGELAARLGAATAPIAAVREAVLDIRRNKSMVYDASDPNHRSCGSFFINPIVTDAYAEELVRAHGELPRFAAGTGRTKLAAAWLIEHAGFAKGYRDGTVGLSTNHALAIVNHGGATAADVVRLATKIRAAVTDVFGVELRPEPDFLGFGDSAVLTPL